MDTNTGLNRHTKFASMAAIAAGLVSFIMMVTFLDILTPIFLPAVMIMVFLSARSAFRRRMKNRGALTGKVIFSIALEVGTLSHYYTFALFFPLYYFIMDFNGITLEVFGSYVALTLMIGTISLLMFVWIAVPMYVGVGHLLKSMEKGALNEPLKYDDAILDDGLLTSDVDTAM
ncbi:MAG: hypothetical protein P8P74_18905 [Crocinitomicaceae bacterium]|nr:hypothetical protein [Crocinitomicaceae bacterium]